MCHGRRTRTSKSEFPENILVRDPDGWISPRVVYASQQFRADWSFARFEELEEARSGHDFRVGELVDQIVKLLSIRHDHLF